MTRYAMAIDLDHCIGCYNCQVACKDEHVGNDYLPIAKSQPTFWHFWIEVREQERVLSPSHIKVAYIPTHYADLHDYILSSITQSMPSPHSIKNT